MSRATASEAHHLSFFHQRLHVLSEPELMPVLGDGGIPDDVNCPLKNCVA